MHLTDYQKVKDLLWNNLFIFDGGDEKGTKVIFADDLAKALTNLGSKSADRINNVSTTDRIMIGTSEGTKSIEIGSDMFELLDAFVTVPMRRMIFRGKNLGSAVTAEQWNEIDRGTFRGMFTGDYWVINGFTWRIADFDYWYDHGDWTIENYYGKCLTHHVTIFPDSCIGSSMMYERSEAEIKIGGYVNSVVSKSMPNTKVVDAFGLQHLVDIYDILTNHTIKNGASGVVSLKRNCDLPSESMIFGCFCNSTGPSQEGRADISVLSRYELTRQLALINIDPNFIMVDNLGGRLPTEYWLRNITPSDSSIVNFSVVGTGCCNSHAVYDIEGVRPIFGICKENKGNVT